MNQQKLRVLHLDDEIEELKKLRLALLAEELEFSFIVESVTRVENYFSSLNSAQWDIIILDIKLSESLMGGISLLAETRSRFPHITILMCSSLEDAGTIKDCFLSGADDFISKQSERAELCLRVTNAYKLDQLKRGKKPHNADKISTHEVHNVAGQTLERIAARVPQLVHSAITSIHIIGESGTGKEVVADLIASFVSPCPFIKVNCGGISASLMESELFGYAKGAFTGATSEKKGYIEEASGGWLFLDEISCLSTAAQTALLRVLENQEVVRLGEVKPRKVNVRIVSACNEPIGTLVQSGKFRQDLWQRLREAEIQLSPLRERPGEIPALVDFFCKFMTGGPYKVTHEALEVLSNISWKSGNVRELRNCLRAMTEFHVNKILTPLSIPDRVWELDEVSAPLGKESIIVPQVENTGGSFVISVRRTGNEEKPYSLDDIGDQIFLECLKLIGQRFGRVSLRMLARILDTSRSTLSRKLKHVIDVKLISISELGSIVSISETD